MTYMVPAIGFSGPPTIFRPEFDDSFTGSGDR